MASATVGRAIVATRAHENSIVSHHFMRVVPHREDRSGWVYAFLRSSQARLMMSGTQYASVIRHIEPHHLELLPIPEVSDAQALLFEQKVAAIVEARNKAAGLGRRRKQHSRKASALSATMLRKRASPFPSVT